MDQPVSDQSELFPKITTFYHLAVRLKKFLDSGFASE
jgi:hypothetical protein